MAGLNLRQSINFEIVSMSAAWRTETATANFTKAIFPLLIVIFKFSIRKFGRKQFISNSLPRIKSLAKRPLMNELLADQELQRRKKFIKPKIADGVTNTWIKGLFLDLSKKLSNQPRGEAW